MASELHLGDSNWKLFQVGYPVDTPTDMSFLLRVSVTHRPALARSILGRWKERSLPMKPPSLPIVQGISRPTKGIRNTFWHNGTQCKNENKGEKPPSLETLQKRKKKGNQQKRQIVQTNPQQEWIQNKGGKGKEMEKRTQRIDMANTEKRKEKKEERYNYWTTNKYLCLI